MKYTHLRPPEICVMSVLVGYVALVPVGPGRGVRRTTSWSDPTRPAQVAMCYRTTVNGYPGPSTRLGVV